jgi:putative membrane protein insertion efficiency factor
MPVYLILALLAKPPHETNPVTIVLKTTITLYQHVVSSSQADACNFHPSCSRFAQRAIERYGFLWGTLMTSDRLMRCNPFAYRYMHTYYTGRSRAHLYDNHIYDPVENNYIFAPVHKGDVMHLHGRSRTDNK